MPDKTTAPPRTSISVYVTTRTNAQVLADMMLAEYKSERIPIKRVTITDAVDLAVSEAIAERGSTV